MDNIYDPDNQLVKHLYNNPDLWLPEYRANAIAVSERNLGRPLTHAECKWLGRNIYYAIENQVLDDYETIGTIFSLAVQRAEERARERLSS